jgi:hypothetical protein
MPATPPLPSFIYLSLSYHPQHKIKKLKKIIFFFKNKKSKITNIKDA